MGIALNGSTYLRYAGKIPNNLPVGILVFVAGSNSIVTQAAVMAGQASGDRQLMFWFESFGDHKTAYQRNPSTNFSSSKNTAPNISPTIQQLALSGFATNSRSVAFGSNVFSTPDTSVMVDDITNYDQILIGAYQSDASNGGVATFFLTGTVAEVHFLNRLPTSADYDAILGGALPETLSGWLDGFPLRTVTDLTSLGGSRTLSIVGTGATTSPLPHPVVRSTPGPTISVHPTNQTVTTPATASFSVTAAASGGGALSYQWQRSTNSGGSWANVSTGTGGTTSAYTTAATTVSGGNANNGDQYRCLITETGGTNPGTATSNAATLTVNAAAGGPTINTQPTNQTVVTPTTASFSVVATTSGGALSYQWQRSTNGGGSWANVSTGTGGTTANYTTAATSVSGGNANNGDQYRCAVTDSNGTTNSNAATLTVNAALAGLTSSPLKLNNGTLHLSAPFEAFVLNVTTGALIVRKTGLTSHATTGVVTFTDAALTAATQYRVVWRRTDTGAMGVELLTAA